MIQCTRSIALDERSCAKISFAPPVRAARMSNKVETAVSIALQCRVVAFPARSGGDTGLIALAGKRYGWIWRVIITARRFRTQERNRADALERSDRNDPRGGAPTLRRPAAPPPTLGSKLRRLDGKKQRARPSSFMRGKPDHD